MRPGWYGSIAFWLTAILIISSAASVIGHGRPFLLYPLGVLSASGFGRSLGEYLVIFAVPISPLTVTITALIWCRYALIIRITSAACSWLPSRVPYRGVLPVYGRERPRPMKFPWIAVGVAVAVMFAIAVFQPFDSPAMRELWRQITGAPNGLAAGNGKSMRLGQDTVLQPGCAATDLGWSPDGSAIVVGCSNRLVVWPPDGHSLDELQAMGSRVHHMKVLNNPLRVVDLTRVMVRGREMVALVVWDVARLTTSAKPAAVGNFDISQDEQYAAFVDSSDKHISVISMDDGHVEHSIDTEMAIETLRWLPGTHDLLIGTQAGILSRVDTWTSQMRELARPYATSFPNGGAAIGRVDGLSLSPDGKQVAIFMTGANTTPAPGTNSFDNDAEAKWQVALGSSLQLRSVADGRLIKTMKGGAPIQAGQLAWDPRNRFVAFTERSGLYLWSLADGAVGTAPYNSQ